MGFEPTTLTLRLCGEQGSNCGYIDWNRIARIHSHVLAHMISRWFKSHLGLGFCPSLRTSYNFIISVVVISLLVYSLRRVVGRISICINVTA